MTNPTPPSASTDNEQDELAPKRYELNIADLLQIPEDSFDNFLIDLKKWHKAARSMLTLLNTIAESAGEKEVPAEFTKLIWIDDGKHDGKVIISVAPAVHKTDMEGGGEK